MEIATFVLYVILIQMYIPLYIVYKYIIYDGNTNGSIWMFMDFCIIRCNSVDGVMVMMCIIWRK